MGQIKTHVTLRNVYNSDDNESQPSDCWDVSDVELIEVASAGQRLMTDHDKHMLAAGSC